MKCEEYTIMYGTTLGILITNVNALLDKDFTLVGGASYSNDEGIYIQAMCKIKKE